MYIISMHNDVKPPLRRPPANVDLAVDLDLDVDLDADVVAVVHLND